MPRLTIMCIRPECPMHRHPENRYFPITDIRNGWILCRNCDNFSSIQLANEDDVIARHDAMSFHDFEEEGELPFLHAPIELRAPAPVDIPSPAMEARGEIICQNCRLVFLRHAMPLNVRYPVHVFAMNRCLPCLGRSGIDIMDLVGDMPLGPGYPVAYRGLDLIEQDLLNDIMHPAAAPGDPVRGLFQHSMFDDELFGNEIANEIAEGDLPLCPPIHRRFREQAVRRAHTAYAMIRRGLGHPRMRVSVPIVTRPGPVGGRRPYIESICGICACEVGNSHALNEASLGIYPCGHIFHLVCGRTWQNTGRTGGRACPSCRAPGFFTELVNTSLGFRAEVNRRYRIAINEKDCRS